MIGLLIGAYCLGRSDAKAARRPRARSAHCAAREVTCYRLGYRDELRRMAHELRLAQLELELYPENREGA